ncbi:MAG: hypothetical protein KJ579_00950 [Verrucomicrobia bacterium]|nr:hypothetical protein [Verrucomicrobiota bacterium]
MLVAILCAAVVAGDADAAKRSKKQQEIDAQREEMRQRAEQRQKDPTVELAPAVLPSNITFTPIPMGPVLPPWEAARRKNGASAPTPGFTVSVPDPFEPSLPSNLTARTAESAPAAPAAETDPAPKPAAPTRAVPVASGGPEVPFENPSFMEGAGLFNEAYALFKKFQEDKDAGHLGRIPSMCTDAVKAFEICRAAYPSDARIPKYIDQCYGLTRYARQSELMASGQASQ